jgi:hypothetical protein
VALARRACALALPHYCVSKASEAFAHIYGRAKEPKFSNGIFYQVAPKTFWPASIVSWPLLPLLRWMVSFPP